MGSSATRPSTLPAAGGLRQRNKGQLQHAPRPGRHAGRGTAAELPDPDDRAAGLDHGHAAAIPAGHLRIDQERLEPPLGAAERDEAFAATRDRKSTRLNSSHLGISYAVF